LPQSQAKWQYQEFSVMVRKTGKQMECMTLTLSSGSKIRQAWAKSFSDCINDQSNACLSLNIGGSKCRKNK
jgi:hypothetical protein